MRVRIPSMLIFGWAGLGSVISSHKSDNLREIVARDNPNQTSRSGARARPATPRMRVTGLAGSFRQLRLTRFSLKVQEITKKGVYRLPML